MSIPTKRDDNIFVIVSRISDITHFFYGGNQSLKDMWYPKSLPWKMYSFYRWKTDVVSKSPKLQNCFTLPKRKKCDSL